MTPTRTVAHVVHVNFAWAQKSIELARRSKGFDCRVFSATRLRIEVTYPVRVN